MEGSKGKDQKGRIKREGSKGMNAFGASQMRRTLWRSTVGTHSVPYRRFPLKVVIYNTETNEDKCNMQIIPPHFEGLMQMHRFRHIVIKVVAHGFIH